jgi:hypothetical protein
MRLWVVKSEALPGFDDVSRIKAADATILLFAMTTLSFHKMGMRMKKALTKPGARSGNTGLCPLQKTGR